MQLEAVLSFVGNVFLITGIFIALFGKKLFKAFLFVVGGVIIGGGALFILLNAGADTIIALILGIAGFFAGGYLTLCFFYWVIFSVGGLAGYIIATLFFPEGGIAQILAILIIGGILGAIVVLIFEAFLAISTALTGSHIARLGLMMLGIEMTETEAFAWILFIMGAIFQVFFVDSIFEWGASKGLERLNVAAGKIVEKLLPSRLGRRKRKFNYLGIVKSVDYIEDPRDFEKAFEQNLEEYNSGKISWSSFDSNIDILLENLQKNINIYEAQEKVTREELARLDEVKWTRKYRNQYKRKKKNMDYLKRSIEYADKLLRKFEKQAQELRQSKTSARD